MNDAETTVLLIEDNAGDARLIQELLAEAGATQFRPERADSLSASLARLEQGRIDLVLLDLALPDSEGLDTFTRVQAQAPQVPIIVLTGLNDETLAVATVRAGAQDYLVKGQMNSDTLARAIHYAIERKRAEEALRKLSQKDEEALRIACMGHWEFDVATAQFVFNDQYYSLHGTTAEQAGGYLMSAEKFASKYVLPDDAYSVGKAIQQAIETNDPNFDFQTETRILRADGEPRVFAVWFHIEKDPEGRTTKLIGVNQDITERKRAEEALRESEHRFRSLIENTSDLFLILNPDYTIAYVSPSIERILGHTVAAVVGARITDFIDPQELPEVIAATEYRARTPGPSPFLMPVRVRHADGSWRVLEGRGSNLFHQPGVSGLVINARDITERKRAEEESVENELKYRTLFKSMRQGFYLSQILYDEDGIPCDYMYIDVNSAFEQIMGLKQEQIIGKTFKELVPPDPESGWLDCFKRVAMTGIPENYIFTSKIYDGWFEVYAFKPEEGKFSALVKDITESKRVEKALRQAESKYHDIFENATEGIFQSTPAGKFITVNPAFARMLGYNSPQEMITMVTDIARQVYVESPRRDEFVRLMAEQGNVTGFEFQMRRKDGGILWVSENVRTVRDSEGRILFYEGMVEDITERKQAEDALRERNNYIETILENSPIGFAVNTIDDGKGVFVSSKFEEIYGIPRGCINTVDEYFERVYLDPVFREQIRTRIMTDMASGDAARMRWENIPITTIKSEHKVVTAINIPLLDRNLMVSTVQDVTQRWRAEEALRQSEDEYRQLFQNNPNPMWAYDPETLAFLAVNDAAVSHYGYSRDEFLAMTIKDIRPPEDIPALIEATAHLPAGLKDPKVWRHKKKDGTILYVEISTHWSTFAGKRARIVLANDVTERKRAEEEIHRRADQFAALYDTARDLAEHQDLPTLLQAIVDRATKLLAVPGGGMYLYDEMRGDLHVVVTKGAPFPIGARVRFGEGMAGRVAQTRQPLIVDNYQTWEGRLPQYADMPIAATIEVPMIFGGELIGVLAIFEPNETVRKFTEMDARLLSLFASSAAGAVHTARLLDETRRRADEFAALYETAHDLAAQQDVDALIKTIVQRATELFATPNGAICLYDPARDDLVIAAAQGSVLPVGTHIKIGEGVSGIVAQTRAPLLIANYSQWEHRLPQYAENLFGAAATVPMLYGGKLIGTLNVAETGFSSHQFTEADLRLLTLFAGLAAGAVHNAGLLKETIQRGQQQAALYHISTTLAQLRGRHELCQAVVSTARETLHYPFMGIFLVDPETGARVLQALDGWDDVPADWRLTPGTGVSEKALVTGELQYWRDATQESTYVAGRHDTHSEVDVPIKIGDKVLGLLIAEDPRVDAFDADDFAVLQAVANQLAVALENTRLFDETRERAEQLALLYDAGLTLNRTLEPRAQLELLCTIASKALHADNISFFRYDAAQNDVYYEFGVGLVQAKETLRDARFPLGAERGLIGWVAQNRVPFYLPDVTADPRWIISNPITRSALWVPVLQDEKLLGVLSATSTSVNAFTSQDERLFVLFANQVAVAMVNARLFEETHRRAEQLATFNEIGKAVSAQLKLESVLETVYQQVKRIIALDAFYVAFYDAETRMLNYPFLFDEGKQYDHPASPLKKGTAIQHVIEMGEPILLNRAPEEIAASIDSQLLVGNKTKRSASLLFMPLQYGARNIGIMSVQSYTLNAYAEEHLTLLSGIANQVAIAIENARLFDETRQRLTELEAVNQVSTALRAATTLDEMLPRLLDETLQILDTDAGALWLYNPSDQKLHPAISRGWFSRLDDLPISLGEGTAGHVFKTGQLYVSRDYANDPITRPSVRSLAPAGAGGVTVPIRTAQEIIGVLYVGVTLPRELTASEIRLLTTLTEIAGNAIHRTRLHTQTEIWLQQLSALHAIDIAITGSTDLNVTLNLLLSQVVTQLHVDAASILLLNPLMQTLEYAAGQGFRSRGIEQSRLQLGEGLAGKAVLERRMMRAPNLQDADSGFARAKLLSGEDFIGYYAVPLISKGQVKGVLDIFQRAPLEPEPAWLDFLQALATQAAIAIDSAQLFENLQRSNLDLERAYDTTIEGWSHALDLRDKETEGHTQRVTEITMRLAKAMGVGDAELVHVRRGVLLHDIGKMGVPDSVLLKPDQLTDTEWILMRQHPQLAFELLAPIAYLHSALDVPYCHHEKWDGTGYPRGLKGEQIPLAARIFEIVDVWDAVISDRPYRAAWSKEKALEHIREQSGKHFDPRVVEIFLREISKA